ncbi:MAG: IS21-like element helper ATPase IstB [Deltaproteobacteria bacterium]|nr:IS21-like element helper ATPase IstB [Deltaproteobacteria bacterium]
MKKSPPSSLRDLCLRHCQLLRIPITPDELDAVLDRADKESLSHLKFLDLLLGQQAAARNDRSIERRVRAAQFDERQLLETFDWKFNPQIDRLQIEELASADFIRRQSNIIIVGQAGVGKSHLIQAIGMRACAAGYRVLYRTSAKLLNELNASLADKSLPLRLRHYQRPELLIIDEFAFDKVERLDSPESAHLLYKVIVGRHRRRSTALLTNIDFDAWADYLGDPPLAMALLDRLVEGAIIIKIKGRSYRASKAITAKSSENPTP